LERVYATSSDEIERLSGKAVAIAQRLHDPTVLTKALHARHQAIYSPARLGESAPIALQAVTAAEASGNLELLLTTLCWRIFEPLHLGEIERVDRDIAAIAALADQLRQPTYTFVATGIRAMRAIMAGTFDQAWRLARQQREIGHRFAVVYSDLWWWLLSMHLGREQGDLASMEREAASLHAQFERDGTWNPPWLVQADHAIILAEMREMATAGTIFRALMERVAIVSPPEVGDDPNLLHALAHTADACALVGAVEHAEWLHALLLPFADINVTAGGAFMFAGPVSYYVGLLEMTLEQWDAAERSFAQALALNERMGTHPFAARTRYSWADLLVRRGRPDDQERALALLNQTMQAAEEIGMTLLARQALALKVRLQGILRA
jgi:hypothetical protein